MSQDPERSVIADVSVFVPAYTQAAPGLQLELGALEVSQRVSLTGSLKASLTEIVALTSAGELTVTASYRPAIHSPAANQ
jgi:hypothetical protein